MGFKKPSLLYFLILFPLAASADPDGDLRNALTALSRTSYRWETTGRQKFSGETTEPRLNPNAPIEVQGKVDADDTREITLLPSRELPVPVTAVFRQGRVVVQTPVGWVRRSEIGAPGPDREVEFGGKQVRLSRALAVADKAAEARTPADELFNLLADLKSCRSQDGLLIAELRDRTVEKLWGEARAKSAPEIQGTVILKISDQQLTEYHLVLAIGFPNNRTKKIAWSMQQWSTRITGIGSTTIDPSDEAVKVLEK